MEKERRRDKESLYLRIGAMKDKLESEKNNKKNSFEEKIKSKNAELAEVKIDLQKIKNTKDTFEKDIKSKDNEIAEINIELKRVNNLIEEETSSRIFLAPSELLMFKCRSVCRSVRLSVCGHFAF